MKAEPDGIRRYRPGDHEAIATIFCRAVHEIASRDYTPEQCDAWSDRHPNPAHWAERCERMQPWVSIRHGEVAGFLELEADGHIDCAYVHPDHQRQGVMTALVRHACEWVISHGGEELRVEASLTARPLFEKLGFEVLEKQTVWIGEVALENFAMRHLHSP